jgi:hypothetical protein
MECAQFKASIQKYLNALTIPEKIRLLRALRIEQETECNSMPAVSSQE